MNIYVVVEGKKASKKIYKTWIPFVNPKLKFIDYLSNLGEDNFYIIWGYGQSQFLNERIEQAINDVNKLPFDRLVLAIDSEEMTLQDKQAEVKERVDRIGCSVEVKYVIQHFCLETWLLGNKKNFRRKTKDEEINNYRTIYDVRNNDPELLPGNEEKSWNRSQFAYNYLRAGLRDVHAANRVSYTKANPGIVLQRGYFYQVSKRCLDEQHILSFQEFLNAFA